MTVLISDSRRALGDSLASILDTFLTDADLARGLFIKPNIVFPVKPASGEITSPVLVSALVSALRERRPGIDIVLGEGVAAGCDPQENFKVSGYTELAHALNVPLLDLHNVERQAVPWKFGSLELPRVALERTYINLPILKPSSACVVSGALKNQKGLVLPEIKKRFHCLGLHEQLAELNAVLKPALTILDGSRFFGPKVLISGDNCGEIDATVCDALGIEEPAHVRLSRECAVFAPGFRIEGPRLRNKQDSSELRPRPSKQLGRLRLWSNPRACTMCRYLFHEIRQDALTPRNLRAKAKLLEYGITGTEILMGSRAEWQKEYGNVLCVGNCTRSVARRGGYVYIPGCPPTLQDLYDNLLRENRTERPTGKGSES
ncbi:MAG: DUF362 domain-containing protein [Anaerolineae bacterium]